MSTSRSSRFEALERRIDTLEAENRRFRRSTRLTRVLLAIFVTVPLVAALTVHPDFSGQVLNVRGLNIVDEEGVHRIEFGIETVPRVAIFYGRTFLSRGSPGAYVRFFDDEGTEQGGISISDDGGISIGLDSRTGQNISLGTSADGRRAAIRFWTVAGGTRATAAIGIADGEPRILLGRGGRVIFQVPRDEQEGTAAGPKSDYE